MDLNLSPSNDPLLLRALNAGERAWQRGNLPRARLLLSDALRRAKAHADLAGQLSAHQLLGHVAMDLSELLTAQSHHRAILRLSKAHNIRLGSASALHNLGLVALSRSKLRTARRLLIAAATCYQDLGHQSGAAAVQRHLDLLNGLG